MIRPVMVTASATTAPHDNGVFLVRKIYHLSSLIRAVSGSALPKSLEAGAGGRFFSSTAIGCLLCFFAFRNFANPFIIGFSSRELISQEAVVTIKIMSNNNNCGCMLFLKYQ